MPAMRRIGGAFELPNASVQSSTPFASIMRSATRVALQHGFRAVHLRRCCFEVNGPLRDVVLCHCTECRRWAGHVWAATAARFDELEFSEERGLRWIDSPDSVHDARRGFCGECGSSLFWQVPGSRR